MGARFCDQVMKIQVDLRVCVYVCDAHDWKKNNLANEKMKFFFLQNIYETVENFSLCRIDAIILNELW